MSSENLLFIDLETNDIDISKAEIIEVGFILSTKSLNIIKSGSFLIKCENEVPEKIQKILELNKTFLEEHGYEKSKGLETLSKLIASAKYIVTHNGLKFDCPIIERILGNDIFNDKIQIDTLRHLPKSFYEKCESKKLKYICIEKAILFPEVHRAIHDINMVFCLVKQFKNELEDIIKEAEKPVYKFMVIPITQDDKDLLKTSGGYWNSIDKHWEIELNETDYSIVNDKLILDLASNVNKIHTVSVSFDQKDKAKEIGASWDSNTKKWIIKLSESLVDTLKSKGYPIV